MDLTTEQGRQQAIATGGELGRLALIIEGALDHHANEKGHRCWEILQSLSLPDALELNDNLERVENALKRGGEEELVAAVGVVQNLFQQVEALDADLAEYARQVRGAIEVLEGK